MALGLDAYYSKHGRYPESLAGLADIEYCDGTPPEMLAEFNYVSYGDRCVLSYFSKYLNKEVKTVLHQGKMGKILP